MLEFNTKGIENRRVGRNRQLVLETLGRSPAPMSAYQILDELKCEGLQAPLQVYRALDQLIRERRVHKIESLSAFTLCTHDDDSDHRVVVFTICEKCRQTSEVHAPKVTEILDAIAGGQQLRMSSATVELTGLCETCDNG